MLQSASKKRPDGDGRQDHATHSDFCAIFLQQLERLYSLALILTGNELSAEKCFLAAFESCAEESHVFKESAESFSRRSVIKQAIRLTSPMPSKDPRPHFLGNRNTSLKFVQELPPF